MLAAIGAGTLDDLFASVPAQARLRGSPDLPPGLPEPEVLSKSRVPPMASASRRDSVSPMPEPSTSLSLTPRRSKGEKTRSCFSFGMPSPVSATRMRSRPSRASPAATVTRPAGRLYLMALDSRLSSTCWRRWRSA